MRHLRPSGQKISFIYSGCALILVNSGLLVAPGASINFADGTFGFGRESLSLGLAGAVVLHVKQMAPFSSIY